MRVILHGASQREAAHRFVDAMPEKPVMEVVFRRYTESRRPNVLAYLFGVAYPAMCQHIMDSTGKIFDAEQVHDMMKKRFLAPYIRQGTSGENPGDLIYTTEGMEDRALREFRDKIIFYANDRLGMDLPPPTPAHERER